MLWYAVVWMTNKNQWKCMLWCEISMLWYDISMLYYEMSMICYDMGYVVKICMDWLYKFMLINITIWVFILKKKNIFEQKSFSFLQQSSFFSGSQGKGFIVVFMKNTVNTTKNIYITSERDVKINITTSSRLSPSLKIKIDRNIVFTSSQHIILPTELELKSFQKEVKSV